MTEWIIAVVGGAVGGLWIGIVAMEYRRLGRMHREVAERIQREEKTRK
jgi:hypothetical protein